VQYLTEAKQNCTGKINLETFALLLRTNIINIAQNNKNLGESLAN